MYKAVYDKPLKQLDQNQPGLVALRKVITELYHTGDYGILSRRTVRGGKTLSVHAEGRAWDCRCDVNSQKEIGDEIANQLWRHHQQLGVQKIIWNEQVISTLEPEWKYYTGEHRHKNHLHIELTWEAARDKPLIPEYIRNVLKSVV